MPSPLKPQQASDRYSIKIDKDDLSNDSQYNDAVSWICGRMIGVFGLHQFMLRAITSLSYSFRGVDGRKKVWKDLGAAEERLLQAAFDYDRAREAVRADEAKGRRK